MTARDIADAGPFRLRCPVAAGAVWAADFSAARPSARRFFWRCLFSLHQRLYLFAANRLFCSVLLQGLFSLICYSYYLAPAVVPIQKERQISDLHFPFIDAGNSLLSRFNNCHLADFESALPEPLCLPPPSCLLIVAQARPSASSSETPFFS